MGHALIFEHFGRMEAFVEIARAGSFHGAAKSLRVSQSALSHSMKLLETHLGVILFDRHKRGIKLTHQGELLYAFAEEMLLNAQQVESDMHRKGSDVERILNIVAHETMAAAFGPKLLLGLRKKFPKTLPNVIIEPSISLILEGIRSKKFDIGILASSSKLTKEGTKIRRKTLCAESYFIYGPTKNRMPKVLRPNTKFNFADTYYLPLFLFKEAIGGTHKRLDLLLQSKRIMVHRTIQVNNFEIIKSYIKAGLGFGILPGLCAKSSLADGSIQQVTFDELPAGGFGHHSHDLAWREDDQDAGLVADWILSEYSQQ